MLIFTFSICKINNKVYGYTFEISKQQILSDEVIGRHFPHKHQSTFPILDSSAVSLSLFPLLLELKSLDEICGSKSYGLSLYKSGRLSFPVSSLSEEECSLEDIVMNWKTLAR